MHTIHRRLSVYSNVILSKLQGNKINQHREGHFIMVKALVYQEDKMIIHVYLPKARG